MTRDYYELWLITTTWDPRRRGYFHVSVGAENAARSLQRLKTDIEQRPPMPMNVERVIVEDIDVLFNDPTYGSEIQALLKELVRYGRKRSVEVKVRSEVPLTLDLLGGDRDMIASSVEVRA